MVYDILLVSLGAIFGMFLTRIIINYSTKKALKKLHDEVNAIFQQVLDNINTGRSTFNNRINNNVTINTKLNIFGVVNIMYIIDKRDIAIFVEEKCIYTSDMVDRKIIESIMNSIDTFYDKEINDIVNVMGIIYNKADFEKKFNVKIDDLKKNIYGPQSEVSDVAKIIKDNQAKFSIDTILDRISSVGIDNLTDAERRFLDNYNSK